MRRQLRDCRRICEAEGLPVLGIEYRGSGHIAMHTPRGVIFCSATPDDQRWRRQVAAIARRLARG